MLLSNAEVIYIYKKALARLQRAMNEQPNPSVLHRGYIIALIVAQLFTDLDAINEVQDKHATLFDEVNLMKHGYRRLNKKNLERS